MEMNVCVGTEFLVIHSAGFADVLLGCRAAGVRVAAHPVFIYFIYFIHAVKSLETVAQRQNLAPRGKTLKLHPGCPHRAVIYTLGTLRRHPSHLPLATPPA